MKKALCILVALLALVGCNKKEVVRLSQQEVFGGTQTIQVLEGDKFNLQDWYKDSEAFTYSTDSEVDTSKVGGKVILVNATAKDGQVYTKGQYVEVISVETLYTENNLTLQTGQKLDDLAVKEGYKITYSGDIDYDTAGDYVIKLHVTDPSGKEYDVERTVTVPEKPVQTVSGGGSSGTTQVSYTGNSDIMNLAYSWEGRSGNCEDIAFQFQRALGYLQGDEYNQSLRHYVRDFKQISSPYPGGTLVEYNNGSHVAVYLGDGLCLHGNYNGVAKVAACNIENITAYWDVTTTNSEYDDVRPSSGSSSSSEDVTVQEMRDYIVEQTKQTENGQEVLSKGDAQGFVKSQCTKEFWDTRGKASVSGTYDDDLTAWCLVNGYNYEYGWWD